ncbi:MAG: DUF2752 domain-containing protein [Lachnospiraceae bacterium]|nr:DUF2752 domain-containing protein [Lachnospiraceae bacterium]
MKKYFNCKMKREDLSREEENALYWAGLIALPIALIGAYIAVYWILPNIPTGDCIFWKLFGAYCPGCGGTRAVVAFMHGDILLSLWYHPLIMYIVAIYTVFMFTHTLEKLHFPIIKGIRFRIAYLYGTLGIIAVNCVVKNVLKFAFGIEM